MLSHRHRDKFAKIAGMNARIVLSWVDFWTVTLMWKNGQNETEHFTWMLPLTGKTAPNYYFYSWVRWPQSSEVANRSMSCQGWKWLEFIHVCIGLGWMKVTPFFN